MTINVETPDDSGDGKLRLVASGVAPLDACELQFKMFKILQGIELISTLVQTERTNLDTTANREHEAFLDNVEFLASTLADMSCIVLDNLPSVDDGEPPQDEPSVYETRGFHSASN